MERLLGYVDVVSDLGRFVERFESSKDSDGIE